MRGVMYILIYTHGEIFFLGNSLTPTLSQWERG